MKRPVFPVLFLGMLVPGTAPCPPHQTATQAVGPPEVQLSKGPVQTATQAVSPREVQLSRGPATGEANVKPQSFASQLAGVATSSEHGLRVAPDRLALVSGVHAAEPGVEQEVWNLALKKGFVHAFIQVRPGKLSEDFARYVQHLGIETWAMIPFQAIQAKIPFGALADLAAMPEVHRVGTTPFDLKFHPNLVTMVSLTVADEKLPAWLSLMGDDFVAGKATPAPGFETITHVDGEGLTRQIASTTIVPNGPFQELLEGMGVEVKYYRMNTRTFAIEATVTQLMELAHSNEVHFLDYRPTNQTMHDSSVPMVGQDYLRNSFDGFTTEVGIIDTGGLVGGSGHPDLNINAVGWDTTGIGPFADGSGHGTHVTGTLLGHGVSDERFEGNAPGVGDAGTQRLFIGRFLDDAGNGVGDVSTLYASLSNDFTDGAGATTAKPKVINNSWGAGTVIDTDGDTIPDTKVFTFSGTEQSCIDVDDVVWTEKQCYIFAAGNEGNFGPTTIGTPGVAKNVLTIGSVDAFETNTGDNTLGDISGFSSRGPTGDNRIKPDLVAPGNSIQSCDIVFDAFPYRSLSGTSMATPHATGVVASVMDHYASLPLNPKRVRAWAIGSSIAKGGDLSPASTYGFGLLNAYRLHFDHADWSLQTMDGTVNSGSSNWQFLDFFVPTGTERMLIYCTWDEPPVGTTGGASPVMGDIDLYLDFHADQAGGTSGDIIAFGTANYEYIRIENPPSGTHRIKFWPFDTNIDDDIFGFTENLDFTGVIFLDKNTVHPSVSLASTVTDPYLKPGESTALTSTVSNAENVASNVMLNITSLPFGLSLTTLDVTLEDGKVVDYGAGDSSVVMGAIRPGDSRTATWTIEGTTEGLHSLTTKANNDNGPQAFGFSDFVTTPIYVDGTQPGLVSLLDSPTHPAGVWRNISNVTYNWMAATDNLSGIDGYGLFTSSSPGGEPSTIKDIEEATSHSDTLVEGSWYFKIRSVDNSGNWDDEFEVHGPIQIDVTDPGLVTNLASATHPVGTWRNSTTVDYSWTAAPDNLSGIDGYSLLTSDSPSSIPGQTQLIQEVTNHSEVLADGTWFFKIRSLDNAGNWDAHFEVFGPVLIDTVTPQNVSLVVEPGSNYTLDNLVELAINAIDTTSGMDEMRFSNDGAAWSAWEPMATTKSGWDLTMFGGNSVRDTDHVVWVEVRDLAHNSSTQTGTIHWTLNPSRSRSTTPLPSPPVPYP